MGLEFIDRSIRTSGILLLIFLPFGLFYLGVYPTLAVLSGAVWGIINLLFITRLIRATITPGKIDKFQAFGIGLFKFPLLYVAGYFLLKIPQFDPVFLLVGFTSILGVMVLKVMGRAVLGLDNNQNKQRSGGGLQKAL